MATTHDNERATLREMMGLAEETARLHMESCGRVMGHFYCKGKHGSAQFEFTNPTDDKSRDVLFHRTYFNTLGVNAVATVMMFEARVKGNQCHGHDLKTGPGELRDAQEVVLLIGETGRERFQMALPIERDGKGRFTGFGKTWETAVEKGQGRDSRFVAGIELREWERESALDQAGNLAMIAEIEKRKARQQARSI